MKIKKIGSFILKLFELYVPIATFTVMFIVFILQIFFRYFLNQPITWSYEVSTICFVWTIFLGASYARHTGEHVEFTIFYELVGEKGKAMFRILGNLLISVAFIISIYPIYDYIQFLAIKKTSVLRIPFNVAFFPFIIFIVITALHCIYDLIIDIRKLLFNESFEKDTKLDI
ncbi:TRAP transporter small permease [Bacillus sp. S/N-304-OC-R1]|uniref:TRAP transporter small permease n=1 Tax=Bacillus sp. S/N-304-OC-R1 TaxID=2758034 RepID=UPI001C8E7B51|nr:TRAP transporter small permease [Bacillus sp. S/N-304-OC-R1]MBY0121458.1 TRAP transporter small permease [Bacillus sp. S/N-304-OC-R1]